MGAVMVALTLAGCAEMSGAGPLGAEPPGAQGRSDPGPPDTSPQTVETLVRLGDFTLARGDPVSAVALYGRAHAIEPRAIVPLLRLGSAHARLGSYEESAGAYRAVLMIDPVHGEAQRGLGNALVALNRPHEALPHLETALTVGGDHRAYNSIGVALDLLGRHADAQYYYLQGLGSRPTDLDLGANLALSLALSGRMDEALRRMREVAGAPGATVRHRQNLALVLALDGRIDEARIAARTDYDEAAADRAVRYYAGLGAIADTAARAAAIGGAGAVAVGP